MLAAKKSSAERFAAKESSDWVEGFGKGFAGAEQREVNREELGFEVFELC